MKKVGVPVSGVKLKDGKIVLEPRKYDVGTEIKKARAPRKRFRAAKPEERDFRG